jgi:hypothetical protein
MFRKEIDNMEKKKFILRQIEILRNWRKKGVTDRELAFFIKGYIGGNKVDKLSQESQDALKVMKMIEKDLLHNEENIDILEKYEVYCLTM